MQTFHVSLFFHSEHPVDIDDVQEGIEAVFSRFVKRGILVAVEDVEEINPDDEDYDLSVERDFADFEWPDERVELKDDIYIDDVPYPQYD